MADDENAPKVYKKKWQHCSKDVYDVWDRRRQKFNLYEVAAGSTGGRRKLYNL